MCVREVLFFLVSVPLLGWTLSVRADPLVPVDAARHVGEVATVCGLVVSTKHAPQTIGGPTFLDFEAPFPNTPFTAVILASDRAKFGTPEEALKGKEVCVSGEIRLYRGTPQVILRGPDQLREH